MPVHPYHQGIRKTSSIIPDMCIYFTTNIVFKTKFNLIIQYDLGKGNMATQK